MATCFSNHSLDFTFLNPWALSQSFKCMKLRGFVLKNYFYLTKLCRLNRAHKIVRTKLCTLNCAH